MRTIPPNHHINLRDVRGVFNSKAASHDKGQHFRLLDIDDWPLFIRVNQNTGIQKEIAERLGKIYHEAGFRFVYFDGAEDVPMPYWYNVSRSQMIVYNEMKPTPLFAEGALKSHYGWHIFKSWECFRYIPSGTYPSGNEEVYTSMCRADGQRFYFCQFRMGELLGSQRQDNRHATRHV